MITAIIIIGLLIVISQKKEGVTINLTKFHYLQIDVRYWFLVPSIKFSMSLERKGVVNICLKYEDGVVGYPEELRLVKCHQYLQWLIFKFYFVAWSTTAAGEVYPEGYNFVNDTEEGIAEKQKAYFALI
jgi:hypothetical protein